MCTIEQQKIASTIEFHGHLCPGLTIGFRVAELVYDRMPDRSGADLIAITETDMCAVDAIQYLTGCTFGKGNLIHRDYGKIAFTFFDKLSGTGFRTVMKRGAREKMELVISTIRETSGTIEPADVETKREHQREFLHNIPLNELFEITAPTERMPALARVLASLPCDACGEMMMESRARQLGGKTYCAPCYRPFDTTVPHPSKP